MKKIGASPSDKLFAPVPIPRLPKIIKKLIQGEAISLDEIPEEWKNGELFLDDRSLPFVLYISDQKLFWTTSNYKFHFKWCKTLASMEGQGKRDRYRAKYDICNPVFEINDGKRKNKLKVCLNCCNEFFPTYSHFNANQRNVESKFSIPEFFEKFGKLNLQLSSHPGGIDDYAKDWPNVARKEKVKAQWKCQDKKCKHPMKDYSQDRQNLHVHHINGVKSYNVSDNLQVVCRACHAQKPGHGHMLLLS